MDRGAWWATVHGLEEELDMTQRLNSNNEQSHILGKVFSTNGGGTTGWPHGIREPQLPSHTKYQNTQRQKRKRTTQQQNIMRKNSI